MGPRSAAGQRALMGDRLLADREVWLPKGLVGQAPEAMAAGFRSGEAHLQAAQDFRLPGSQAPGALVAVVHSAGFLHLAAAVLAVAVKQAWVSQGQEALAEALCASDQLPSDLEA